MLGDEVGSHEGEADLLKQYEAYRGESERSRQGTITGGCDTGVR